MGMTKLMRVCAYLPGLLISAQLPVEDPEWQVRDSFTCVGTGSTQAKLHVVDAVPRPPQSQAALSPGADSIASARTGIH